MRGGLCAQTDPEAFFPDAGGSVRAAKAVCAVCPVQLECRRYALERGERFGVWCGLSEFERRALRRSSVDRRVA
ncbi:MAG: WhiB family transcriptional regulator [Actinophytocola sp.]|uniref:WhiB family transcriptional regulator n=1 Tax=Actinophytocola sp. TaxID=1872138 RepID=UPI0013249185|nr:WhiB family transcriptional regulator [Actinophytocola sp.]MPZ85231.1 WhiB family transcriptional regulator [Actinophytocola sp.]